MRGGKCSCCSTAARSSATTRSRWRRWPRTSSGAASSSIAGARVFAEVFGPPPRLVVVGAVDTGEALCAAAKAVGWHTICVDARAQFATRERMPSADELLVEWPERGVRAHPARPRHCRGRADARREVRHPGARGRAAHGGVLRRRARQPPRAGEAPRAARRGRADRRASSHGCEGLRASTSAPRAPPRPRSRSSPKRSRCAPAAWAARCAKRPAASTSSAEALCVGAADAVRFARELASSTREEPDVRQGAVRERPRPGRRGRRGRADRHGVHVHRRPDLDARRVAPLQRHAGRQAAALASRGRRPGAPRPEQQVQRDDARQRRQPDRLRARDELGRPRAPRRDARDARHALGRQGAEQPQRRDRRLGRLDHLHRPDLRPHARVRPRAAAGPGLPGRLPPARGRRRPAAPDRRLRAAERALLHAGRVAALHQRHGARAHSRLRRRPGPRALERPRLRREHRHRRPRDRASSSTG